MESATLLVSLTLCSTPAFTTLSFQLPCSILLHIHTSKAFKGLKPLSLRCEITGIFSSMWHSVRFLRHPQLSSFSSSLSNLLRNMYIPSIPTSQANSAFYPQQDGKSVPAKVRWRSAAGEWRQVWFVPLVDARVVAGKTAWSLVNTCHTWVL